MQQTRASKQPDAEEWAIHDYEHFGAFEPHEYESIRTISRIAIGLTLHGPAFAHWAQIVGTENEEALDNFDEHYLGQWDSLAAYAEDLLDDMGVRIEGLVPGWLSPYVSIDYEQLGKDMANDMEVAKDEGLLLLFDLYRANTDGTVSASLDSHGWSTPYRPTVLEQRRADALVYTNNGPGTDFFIRLEKLTQVSISGNEGARVTLENIRFEAADGTVTRPCAQDPFGVGVPIQVAHIPVVLRTTPQGRQHQSIRPSLIAWCGHQNQPNPAYASKPRPIVIPMWRRCSQQPGSSTTFPLITTRRLGLSGKRCIWSGLTG
ncbi:MAG: antirestriction protein ArdA [Acidimicrobiales bacterium]